MRVPFVPRLRAILSVEQLLSRYFVTAASRISKEYVECCPMKYALPYSGSFIILSVYYKGSISRLNCNTGDNFSH